MADGDRGLGWERYAAITGLMALTVRAGLGSSGRLTYHEGFVAQASREMIAAGPGLGLARPDGRRPPLAGEAPPADLARGRAGPLGRRRHRVDGADPLGPGGHGPGAGRRGPGGPAVRRAGRVPGRAGPGDHGMDDPPRPARRGRRPPRRARRRPDAGLRPPPGPRALPRVAPARPLDLPRPAPPARRAPVPRGRGVRRRTTPPSRSRTRSRSRSSPQPRRSPTRHPDPRRSRTPRIPPGGGRSSASWG